MARTSKRKSSGPNCQKRQPKKVYQDSPIISEESEEKSSHTSKKNEENEEVKENEKNEKGKEETNSFLLKQHEEQCEFECKYCQNLFKREKERDHENSCDFKPI